MLNTSKFNALANFGGGYHGYSERRQALGQGLSPRLPKGGQRRKADIGGDSYGC